MMQAAVATLRCVSNFEHAGVSFRSCCWSQVPFIEWMGGWKLLQAAVGGAAPVATRLMFRRTGSQFFLSDDGAPARRSGGKRSARPSSLTSHRVQDSSQGARLAAPQIADKATSLRACHPAACSLVSFNVGLQRWPPLHLFIASAHSWFKAWSSTPVRHTCLACASLMPYGPTHDRQVLGDTC